MPFLLKERLKQAGHYADELNRRAEEPFIEIGILGTGILIRAKGGGYARNMIVSYEEVEQAHINVLQFNMDKCRDEIRQMCRGEHLV